MPETTVSRRAWPFDAAGKLERGSSRAGARVGDGEDDAIDVALEHRADAHRARLADDVDRQAGEGGGAEPLGGLPQRADDGVRGRVPAATDPIAGAGDHGVVEDRDRTIDALACSGGGRGLGQGGGHVELVVHHGESYTAARPALPSTDA